jgi:hypothetical protein
MQDLKPKYQRILRAFYEDSQPQRGLGLKRTLRAGGVDSALIALERMGFVTTYWEDLDEKRREGLADVFMC